MDLMKLDLDSLPDCEKAFIGGMLQTTALFYQAGFNFESNMNILCANQFRYIGNYDNLALLRTGSGGRFDGTGLGDADLILLSSENLTPTSYPIGQIDLLVDTLREPISVIPKMWTNVSIEHKSMNDGATLSFYQGDRKGKAFPGRIMEAEFLAGNANFFDSARRRVLQEIRDDPIVLKSMKKQLKDHRTICRSGSQKYKNQELVHFDKKSGEVFYHPEKSIFGLKYSFLRYMQLAQAIEIFEFFNRSKLKIDDLLDLNQSVEERIRYCLRKDWILSDRVDQLIETGLEYVKLCDLNSELKVRFFNDGPTSVTINPDLFEIGYQRIVEQCEKGFLKDSA
jgi:hypothetical protein